MRLNIKYIMSNSNNQLNLKSQKCQFKIITHKIPNSKLSQSFPRYLSIHMTHDRNETIREVVQMFNVIKLKDVVCIKCVKKLYIKKI